MSLRRQGKRRQKSSAVCISIRIRGANSCGCQRLKHTPAVHIPLLSNLSSLSALGQDFVRLIRERKSEALLPWLERAKGGPYEELQRFAQGLERELPAVQAALTEPWRAGQVEGQITRLKLLKRQMDGRANLDLLRLRVLHVA